MAGNYAVIENGIVINIIIAENGYEYAGADLVEYQENIFCQPGMFYNKKMMVYSMTTKSSQK
ncbi:hypothetical protein [Klebsiella pneumoniae]|uniref:hypothetical protein n=1 Tax=Klebsiella pneumoniae TaxID=573 RepID=UPI0030CFFFC3